MTRVIETPGETLLFNLVTLIDNSLFFNTCVLSQFWGSGVRNTPRHTSIICRPESRWDGEKAASEIYRLYTACLQSAQSNPIPATLVVVCVVDCARER